MGWNSFGHRDVQGIDDGWECATRELVSQLDFLFYKNGIIRSKGRLENAAMSEQAKHPILIPKNSILAQLIIKSVKERIFHYGKYSTISHLIQKYWIPSMRSQVKSIYRKYSKC
jgi:hypothetical protein